MAQQQDLRFLHSQPGEHAADFGDALTAQHSGKRTVVQSFAAIAIGVQFLPEAAALVGAKNIDRSPRGRAIKPSANQTAIHYAKTATVKAKEDLGSDFFGLRITLRHTSNNTNKALVVFPKIASNSASIQRLLMLISSLPLQLMRERIFEVIAAKVLDCGGQATRFAVVRNGGSEATIAVNFALRQREFTESSSITVLTDGDVGLRTIQRQFAPHAEHVLD